MKKLTVLVMGAMAVLFTISLLGQTQEDLQKLNRCFAKVSKEIGAKEVDLDFKKIQENWNFIKKIFSEPNAKRVLMHEGGAHICDIWVYWGDKENLYIVNSRKCPSSYLDEGIQMADKEYLEQYKKLENLDKKKFIRATKEKFCPNKKKK